MSFVVRSNSGCLEVYYRDTRGEDGHGDFSDVFTSSSNRDYATHYDSREEAEAWAEEFLGDFSYCIKPVT